MKPERLPQLERLGPLIAALGDETIPLDSFVAKAHLIVERELYALLALRLRVGERQLPALNFYALAKLALSGDAYGHARAAVLALNDLRNEYAHELDGTRRVDRIKEFATRAGAFCEDSFGPLAYDRAVRMAATFCLSDVWCHFTDYAIANDLFPSEEARRAAEGELAAFRTLHLQNREFEQMLSATVVWLVDELEGYIHPRRST